MYDKIGQINRQKDSQFKEISTTVTQITESEMKFLPIIMLRSIKVLNPWIAQIVFRYEILPYRPTQDHACLQRTPPPS